MLLGVTWIFYGNLTLKTTSNSQKSVIQKLDLLELQLSLAGPSKKSQNKTLSFSLSEADHSNFQIIQSENTSNISPLEQIKLAKKLAALGAQHVYIHWFYRNALWTEEANEINHVLKKDDPITLISSYDQSEALNKLFQSKINILISDFCNGRHKTVCPYNPKWDFLAIQHFAVKFGQLGPDYLSTSLPNPLPSYIIKPVDKNMLKKKSYSEILRTTPEDVQGKIVFMGVEIIQGAPTMTAPDEIAKVPYLFQSDNNSVRTDGLPVHEYLAAIVEESLNHNWVHVSPESIETTLKVLAPMSVIAIVLQFGIAAGTCFFLFATGALFIANILFIKYFSFYLPDYDSIFLCSLSLIGAGFIKNSLEQFNHAVAENRVKSLANNTDLKSNFISLFSHNLNTPIAKIKGLINALEKQHPSQQPIFENMNYHLSEMQTSIKAILTKNRLEENYLNLELIDRSKIEEELTFEVSPLMKRRLVDFHFENEVIRSIEDDKKLFTAVISCISFYAPKHSKVWFSIASDENALNLEWTSTRCIDEWKTLTSDSNKAKDQNPFASLIHFYCLKRRMTIEYLEEDGGSLLRLKSFVPPKQHNSFQN